MTEQYGTCECGGDLMPVWDTEEEVYTKDGVMYKTGRVRKICTCLMCIECLKSYTVDDSFDESW